MCAALYMHGLPLLPPPPRINLVRHLQLQECRLGVWFGFVGAALLPAVGTCVVLVFGAMPGR